jgi:hypothetical protein
MRLRAPTALRTRKRGLFAGGGKDLYWMARFNHSELPTPATAVSLRSLIRDTGLQLLSFTVAQALAPGTRWPMATASLNPCDRPCWQLPQQAYDHLLFVTRPLDRRRQKPLARLMFYLCGKLFGNNNTNFLDLRNNDQTDKKRGVSYR